jgi:signal transduction histidine kinase/DNA-binding response OmpR family regulator
MAKWLDFCLILFLWVIALALPVELNSQQVGHRFIRNYGRLDYDNQAQNWCIRQDKRGIVYVGNQGGLLEYDGVSWRSIDIPNWSVRSLTVDDTGTVYIGGRGEIGCLRPDSKGAGQYVSLLDHLRDSQKNFSMVWRTLAAEEGVYFHTLDYLFRWDGKEMRVWQPDTRFNAIFQCGQRLLVRQEGIGLLEMKNDRLQLIPGGEIFADKRVYMMVPYDADGQRLLIGTRSQGFYLYDGSKGVPFATEVEAYINENRLYHGIRLNSGLFAIATLRGGVVIIDGAGRLKEVLDRSSGLPDDNVKYVFEDPQGNLWLALNNGISRVEYGSPLSSYDRRADLPGLVLSVIRHRRQLYVGTTSGLYVLTSAGRFRPVVGMSGNCWGLLDIGPAVLAATSDGIFQIEGLGREGGRQIVDTPAYVLLHSGRQPRRVWAGSQQGLISLVADPHRPARWIEEGRPVSVEAEIRTMAEDRHGDLWLGTLAQGVMRLKLAAGEPVASAAPTRYDTGHGLPPREINVFRAAGHVMFGSERGIFRFDEAGERFVPDDTLGREFADGSRNVFRIVEDEHKNIWFHSRGRNFQAVPRGGGTFAVRRNPFLRLPPAQINVIYPDGDIVWFGGTDGLIRYDTAVKKNYELAFACLIRRVRVNGRTIFAGAWRGGLSPAEALRPVLTYWQRNLRFEFAAPFFEAEGAMRYRFWLEGYDEGWSPWTEETRKDYTNLDAGIYRFRVAARNVYDLVSREAVFRFKVLPPWYRTWWAFLLYGLALFFMVFLVVRWRSGKLEQEKRRLEQVVRQRTREIHDKNRQLESQSEKLKEMDHIKSRFFANISHEFRTPLTLIMGPLEQMLSASPGEGNKKSLKLMLRSSQRLFHLINQLLDLSKLDSGKMRLQAAHQDIVPFLKGLLASFDLLAVQRQLDLKFLAPQEHISLYFDAEKMEKIIGNLLANALKFTPPGGSIGVTVGRNPVGSLDITVADTGIGIPAARLPHIFDRFYQVDGPDRGAHRREGSGIGLALVKELVELHHGTIEVRSGEIGGGGTEFRLCFPLGAAHLEPGEIVEPAAARPAARQTADLPADYMLETEESPPNTTAQKGAAPEEGEPGSRERCVILVVEDQADVREYIRGALEPDYAVAEAADGRRGIDMAKAMIPDLIISDIMMPEVDGCELCRVLKGDIDTSHIPIILLTAKASEASMVRGLESGADDYITKPFSTKILTARIRNLIELRRGLQLKIQRQKMLLPTEIAVSSVDETFLKEMQQIIEKNLADPEFTIEQLCQELCMGRTTLFRKVEALTGESPKQFIQSYRLERAAQLLKARFGNVTEVALEVGFPNVSYFTRCFKEKFHQLPSTFQAA